MRTLLQINVVVNWGSTGHIAEDIGQMVLSKGWKSYIAYGRNERHALARAANTLAGQTRLGFCAGYS